MRDGGPDHREAMYGGSIKKKPTNTRDERSVLKMVHHGTRERIHHKEIAGDGSGKERRGASGGGTHQTERFYCNNGGNNRAVEKDLVCRVGPGRWGCDH